MNVAILPRSNALNPAQPRGLDCSARHVDFAFARQIVRPKGRLQRRIAAAPETQRRIAKILETLPEAV